MKESYFFANELCATSSFRNILYLLLQIGVQSIENKPDRAYSLLLVLLEMLTQQIIEEYNQLKIR